MNQFSYEDLPSYVNLQQKKILIAVDLENHSEQIISYSLLVTQRLFCEYTVLYCLGNGVSMELAQTKMTNLLQDIDIKYSHFTNRSIKSIILNESPVSAIQELNKINNYNCVMVGTSNRNDAWEMGIISKSILLSVPADN